MIFLSALYVLEDYEIITQLQITFSMECFKLLNSTFAKVVLGPAVHLLYKCKTTTYTEEKKKTTGEKENHTHKHSKVAQPRN